MALPEVSAQLPPAEPAANVQSNRCGGVDFKAFSGVWDQSWIRFGERVGNRLTFRFVEEQLHGMTESMRGNPGQLPAFTTARHSS